MIFYCNKLYDKYDISFPINDIKIFDDRFIIVRDGGFVEIYGNSKFDTYLVPFWEERSQYWDFEKVVTIQDKIFLIACNISMNTLKLFSINSYDPLSLEFVGSLKEQILNIYDRYIVSAENFYKIDHIGLRKIELDRKFEYYEELKSINTKNVGPVFFLVDNIYIPLFNVNKINHLLNNLGRVRIIKLDDFSIKDIYLSDYVSNNFKYTFVEKEINDNIEIISFDKSDSFLIRLTFDNLHVDNFYPIDNYLLKGFLMYRNTRISKNNELFFVFFNDEYFAVNELYISKNMKDNRLLSKNNNFVSFDYSGVVLISNNTEVKIFDYESFELKHFFDIKKLRRNQGILQEYFEIQKKKEDIIQQFIRSINMLNYEFTNDKIILYFEYRSNIIQVEISNNLKQNISLCESNIQKNEFLVKQDLLIKFDITNFEDVLMLDTFSDKVLIIYKDKNKILMEIVGEKIEIVEILSIVDCVFNNFFTVLLDTRAFIFIDNSMGDMKILSFDFEVEKVKKVGDHNFWILTDQNYVFNMDLSENKLEIKNVKHNFGIRNDFGLYGDKIIFFDNVDSLVMDGELYMKLLPVPIDSVIFYNCDGKLYIIIDKDSELMITNN
ncbi:MAG: hypothetical protein RMJ36_02305 [Candidatus Calescibacterium sp.]|nr:hypothetical protein [Candidatus Calescibacterium sp.]MDW8132471.1 hypothetical protein [Candidatus Calescibacterium sp.]